MSTWEIIEGDCLEALREMPDNSIDSIVTDPPYGLGDEPDAMAMLKDWIETGHHEVKGKGFMGKEWDAFVPQPETWKECLRVLKPGGHLLSFGGTRTYDLVVLGLRIAGFEIRDSLQWIQGQGFPKSLDVSKAIDKAAGAEREVVGEYRSPEGTSGESPGSAWFNGGGLSDITAPATEAAKQWDGWGTATKPGYEPIVMARKPLIGTVAANVQEHGTGGLNIGACRVGADPIKTVRPKASKDGKVYGAFAGGETTEHAGRWPPNLLLGHSEDCGSECAPGCVVVELGEQGKAAGVHGAGARRGGSITPKETDAKEWQGPSIQDTGKMFRLGDTGTAARFFPQFRYCPKPGKREKTAGVTPREASGGEATGRKDGSDGTKSPRAGAGRTGSAAPMHPTSKPIALMRWLVRLVTPPGGTVLDCFAGGGTTGCAAVLEGFNFIGCEMEPEYAQIARERIEFWSHVDPSYDSVPKPEPKAEPEDERQGGLFDD